MPQFAFSCFITWAQITNSVSIVAPLLFKKLFPEDEVDWVTPPCCFAHLLVEGWCGTAEGQREHRKLDNLQSGIQPRDSYGSLEVHHFLSIFQGFIFLGAAEIISPLMIKNLQAYRDI